MHRFFMVLALFFWVLSFAPTQAYIMGLIGEVGNFSFSTETALTAIFFAALAIYEKIW